MPPKGIITHVLLSTLITGIFGIITLRTCVSLTKQKLVAEICAVRWTDRLIWSEDSHLPTNDVMPIPHLSWNDGMHNNIKSMASILRQSLNWEIHFARSLAAGELTLGVTRKYFIYLWSEIWSSENGFTISSFEECLDVCMPPLSSYIRRWWIFRPLILFCRSIWTHHFGYATILQRATSTTTRSYLQMNLFLRFMRSVLPQGFRHQL